MEPNITQTQAEEVTLSVKVHEPCRRHLRAESIRLGKDMGAVVEEALSKHLGPPPERDRDAA